MASDYPDSIDTFTPLTPGTGGSRMDVEVGGRTHAEILNDLQYGVVSTQETLGTDPQGDYLDVVSRLNSGVFHNNTVTNMRPWRRAMTRVQRGTGLGRLLVVGTSSTFGIGPSNEEDQWVTVLADTLMSRTGQGSMCIEPMNNHTCTAGSTKRSYITVGSGWTHDAGGSVGDAGNIIGASGAGGTFSFTHPYCDRFTIYHLIHGTTGTWTTQIDSETPVTGNGGSGSMARASVTAVSSGGVGQHTLKISAPTGGSMGVYFIEAHVGTTGLRIGNFGIPGGLSNDFDNSNNTYSGLPWIDQLNPDLVVFQIGGNDAATSVSVSDFKTRLKTATQYVWDNTPAGIVLCEMIEERGSVVDLSYGEAIREIAAEVGCATFSVGDAMHGDPEAYVDPGNGHFTATGHRLWATAFADALLTV